MYTTLRLFEECLSIYECQLLIKQFKIWDCIRKKEAGTLSGRNKKKLCIAMAVINTTPIVLIGETSAGMDPYSQKLM